MLRVILIALVVGLTALAGIAMVLKHYFGWKGLIAIPFIVIIGGWIGTKIIGKLLKKVMLGMFGAKAVVLRGAKLTVHSVTPIPRPSESAEEEDETVAEDASSTEADEDGEETPRHHYAIDLTITPEKGDRVWEPGEFILTSERITSLEQLEDGEKELATADEIRVWDGTAFAPDEACKYPGEQRLRVTFAVKPGHGRAWLQYYNEPIGELELPSWVV